MNNDNAQLELETESLLKSSNSSLCATMKIDKNLVKLSEDWISNAIPKRIWSLLLRRLALKVQVSALRSTVLSLQAAAVGSWGGFYDAAHRCHTLPGPAEPGGQILPPPSDFGRIRSYTCSIERLSITCDFQNNAIFLPLFNPKCGNSLSHSRYLYYIDGYK